MPPGRARSTGVQGAVDSGQIRRFTGNDYAQPLAKGDLAAAVAWSGDIYQLLSSNPKLRWAIPDKGGDDLDGQHDHPEGRQRGDGVDLHELRLRPEDRRADRRVRRVRAAGQGHEGGAARRSIPSWRRTRSSSRPTRTSRRRISSTLRRSTTRRTSSSGSKCSEPDAGDGAWSFLHPRTDTGALTPYLLLLPGLVWLVLFFLAAARLPRLPVARSRDVRHRVLVRLGVLELLGRDLGLPQAVHPLVRLRRHRDRARPRDLAIRSSTGSRSGPGG